MQPDHVLRFQAATAADLEDPLVREALDMPARVRLVVAAALRVEQGVEQRLGPWVVEEIGRGLGLEPAECRWASALVGYLSHRDETGRIRSYADVSVAGLENHPLSPECFERLSPQEAQAIAIHRQLDRELRPSRH